MNDQPSPDVPPIGPSQPIGVTENDIRQRSQELGILGKLFGSRDHAPINIAGGLMVLGIVAMVLVPMLPESANFSKGDLEKTLGSIVFAALTFLGGYLGRAR